MEVWFVYIVECRRGFYTGISRDVSKRVIQHNKGKGAKAVKALGLPAVLVYKEECASKSEALKRECKLKKLTRAEKEGLIDGQRDKYS